MTSNTPVTQAEEPVQEMHELPNTPPTPDRIGKDAVREALVELVRKTRIQATCLEQYAEQSGFSAKPIPSVFHSQAVHFRTFADEADSALSATPAQPVDETERLHIKALRAAEQFIVNGVEMGYIRMPDAETPDTAHDTLPLIRAALQHKGEVSRG